MATSTFFNNYQSTMEQQLIEDLVTESIRIYGMDVYYIPRTIVSRDDIFQEDDLSEYNSAFLIEMYIKNIDGFGGDGDFLSKFNIEIRDTITFSVSRRTFYDEVAISSPDTIERPREGDLIYFPLNKKAFKITFVEHESIFYQLGSLQMWDLKCELFEYSNERLNTGIEEIDRIEWEVAISADPLAILTGNREFLVDENGSPILQAAYSTSSTDPGVDIDPFAQNQEFEQVGDSIIDFTQIDPFSEGEY